MATTIPAALPRVRELAGDTATELRATDPTPVTQMDKLVRAHEAKSARVGTPIVARTPSRSRFVVRGAARRSRRQSFTMRDNCTEVTSLIATRPANRLHPRRARGAYYGMQANA